MPTAYPEFIDYNMLFDNRICLRSIHIFRRVFPDGFRVTADNILKAQQADLDVVMAAKSFLPIGDWNWFESVHLRATQENFWVRRLRLELACEAVFCRSTELYYQVIDDTKGPIDPVVRAASRTEALCRKEALDAQAEVILKLGLTSLDKEYRLASAQALVDFLSL